MNLEALRNARCGADALVLTSETSRRYATGFHSTAGACYVSDRQAVFLTDFRYTEAAKQQIAGFTVQELKITDSYTDAVHTLAAQDHVRKIALEDESLTVSEYRTWEDGLCLEIVPLGKAIQHLRMRKSEAEIEKIIHAQRIAEQALSDILKEIHAGITEKEIAARLTYLMLHYGAENLSFDPIVVSGAQSSKPHGVPSNKKIEAGDFVTMDFGCIYDGYCSDMTRTVAVGFATDEMKRVYETVLKAQLAGIAAAKAGVTGKSIDAAARKVIEDAGYGEAFGHGFGHGVGLEIHEEPRASQKYEEIIPADTILTAEPGIYLPGKFGVRIEDMLLITEGGCRNLTEAPKELRILPE